MLVGFDTILGVQGGVIFDEKTTNLFSPGWDRRPADFESHRTTGEMQVQHSSVSLGTRTTLVLSAAKKNMYRYLAKNNNAGFHMVWMDEFVIETKSNAQSGSFVIIAAWSYDCHKLAIGYNNGNVVIMDGQFATDELKYVLNQWVSPRINSDNLLEDTFSAIENALTDLKNTRHDKEKSSQSQSAIIETLKAEIETLKMENRMKSWELEMDRKTANEDLEFFMEETANLEKRHAKEMRRCHTKLMVVKNIFESEIHKLNKGVEAIYAELQRTLSKKSSIDNQYCTQLQNLNFLLKQDQHNPEVVSFTPQNSEHLRLRLENENLALVNIEIVKSMASMANELEKLIVEQRRLKKDENKLITTNFKTVTTSIKEDLKILFLAFSESGGIQKETKDTMKFDVEMREQKKILDDKVSRCEPVEFPGKKFTLSDVWMEDNKFGNEKTQDAKCHRQHDCSMIFE